MSQDQNKMSSSKTTKTLPKLAVTLDIPKLDKATCSAGDTHLSEMTSSAPE